jgi:N-acetylglucosaminyldiphosphoundecaprenol N-acetyl-beta-D-mannosaminyltransferase
VTETLEIITIAIRERIPIQHVVVNVAKLVSMHRDRSLCFDVLESDLVSVDGMGIVFGCRMFGMRVPERVTGIDLMDAVLGLCVSQGWRPYLLGAHPEVLAAAVTEIERRYPGLSIAGYHHGYFSEAEEVTIVETIRSANPDCLFVAISSPKKEHFMHRWREILGIPFVMGVGGSLDIVAGQVKRAPSWMQGTGFEWLYRLLQEPRRMWRRYLGTNLAYAWMLASEAITNRRSSPQ